ncbi:MAG TPA: signal peptidase I [Candidatus Dependentiae bacterium]|nr:signal peptidase I [Candidatus Dependentiae bacterium]HRQ62682.1 signal peptidase I [Candidatus Dependentiae bacterium]
MATQQKKQSNFFKSAVEFVGLLLLVFIIRTFGFGLYQVPTGSMETTMLVGERFFADKFTYSFIRKPQRGDIIAFNDVMYTYSDNPIKRLFEEYVYGPQNVTKRIIGIPGDKIRGTVENGRPVIYLNDQKLDEPYLNQYPLIRVYREDKAAVIKQADQEIRAMLQGRPVDPFILDALRERKLEEFKTLKSYDPDKSFKDQPFYQIQPDRVVRGPQGQLELWYPGTVFPPSKAEVKRGNSHWDGSDEFYVELGPDEYWGMGDNRVGSKDCRFFGPIKEHLIHGRIVFRIWSIDSDESWWILDLIKHPIDFFSRVRWSRFLQPVY